MVNINFTDSNSLTTPIKGVTRVKYFPLEITSLGLLPSTNYSVYYNGTLVNSFCKPFGGNLGQQLISNSNGQLLFLFLMAIPYNQTYLVNNNQSTSANGVTLSTTNASLQLKDPNGNVTTTYLPINLKQ